jgi:signal peptidase I
MKIQQSTTARSRSVGPCVRRRWLLLGALTLGIYFLCPFRLSIVHGDSMSPTLRNGELCLLDRSGFKERAPAVGDLVVFRHGNEVLTKRIYGAPGDTVTLIQDVRDGLYEIPGPGHVKRLRQVIRRFARRGRGFAYRVVDLKIPSGSCFVLGDNRGDSVDSRDFGLIDVDSIMGTMVPFATLRGD